MDGQTHGRTTDRLWYEMNIPYFSNEKAGIIKVKGYCSIPIAQDIAERKKRNYFLINKSYHVCGAQPKWFF